MNIWFSSDWHLGHQNIVRGCTEWTDPTMCRDFKTLKEHDEKIINIVNKYVAYDDILYFLGDWSFGGYDNVWKYRRRINCEVIHFIGGNHDHHVRKNKILTTDRGLVNAKDLFTTYNELLEKNDVAGRYDMVLCHYPLLSWHKIKKGTLHLYGHVHYELNYHPNAVCVSLDCHPEFRPFHLDEIVSITKQNQNRTYDTRILDAANRSKRY